MSRQTPEQKIAGLQLEVKALNKTLGTLTSRIVSSSVSSLRIDEASTLLTKLNQIDEP